MNNSILNAPFSRSFHISSIIGLLALLFLSGCTTPQARVLLSQTTINSQYKIENVPFYPQQEFYCGPTTLSEVLNYYGENLSPETIAPSLFIPGREGSLQIEMTASVRQLGYIAYVDSLTLSDLVTLVTNNMPVIILQNNGISWYPQWHYAVVIGYDISSEVFILHTGLSAERRVDMSVLERTWKRAEQWALIPLPPNKTPNHLKQLNYLKAAQDHISVGKVEVALEALETASNYWSEAHLPPLLLANHHSQVNPEQAKYWFERAYALASNDTIILNNYAYFLGTQGCVKEAQVLIEKAIKQDPSNEAFIDTKATIEQMQPSSSTVCRDITVAL